ncbi:MAG TPA: hypothetical protein VL996_05235, partial [Methylocella sp.]|nr:hypothetical protein [Methylocella sp.]
LLNTVLSATYYESWNSLSKQANTTIELMDVPAVIGKMKSYFKAYADAQNDLWNFLVLAGLDPKQVLLLSRWIESDERATNAYNNLITSPVAGDLTHARFSPASVRFSGYLK